MAQILPLLYEGREKGAGPDLQYLEGAGSPGFLLCSEVQPLWFASELNCYVLPAPHSSEAVSPRWKRHNRRRGQPRAVAAREVAPQCFSLAYAL